MLMMQMALKIADVGNCAYPFELAVAWAKMAISEFRAQGDELVRQGKTDKLKVEGTNKSRAMSLAQGQCKWIEYVLCYSRCYSRVLVVDDDYAS